MGVTSTLPPRGKRARSSSYGLPCRPLPEKVRRFVDFDYADTLPEEDRAWLAEFSRRHYLDSREPARAMTREQADLVKSWSGKDNHARRRDLSNFKDMHSYEDISEALTEREAADASLILSRSKGLQVHTSVPALASEVGDE